jgi:general secretion pathway protein A
MYLSFFGLNEKPFAITPDPRYLYLSERHAEALAHLLYGINEAGGFVQLTGEVGTGKTTIIRSLLSQTPKHAHIALILNPRMTAPEFLRTICEELALEIPWGSVGSQKDLVDILNRYLLSAHGEGRRIVLVVDEAQNLSPDVLEQVRLLTNLETNTQKLLQIILIGQPELRELLARTELRQLAQRITGRYHLAPLSRVESEAYVLHRLRVAGATTDVFTSGALAEIFRLSGGVPRVINVICDRALLGAYTQDRHRVSGALVRRAASEVFGRRFAPRWLPWVGASAAAVALAAITAVLWQLAPWGASAREQTAEVATVTAPAFQTPEAKEAPAAAPARKPPVPLSTLLARNATRTGPDPAFGRLFELWNVRYVAGREDPCTQASRYGLECLVQRGSFGQLRLYNRPVILMLNDDTGAPHQVVLSSLGNEAGRIELGDATHDVSIAELARYWLGDYVLLWKPVTRTVRNLTLGMRGDEVRWLRRSLLELQGAPGDEQPSDVFDAELGRLVMDFQRRNRLSVDGVAGLQTQVVLNGALPGDGTPLLSQRATGS